MGATTKISELRKMRQKMAWLLAQAEEYESGRPEIGIENGIFAAAKCREMAASYRRQARNLAIYIAAVEEANT
jgi:hypothetical protein